MRELSGKIYLADSVHMRTGMAPSLPVQNIVALPGNGLTIRMASASSWAANACLDVIAVWVQDEGAVIILHTFTWTWFAVVAPSSG